MFTREQILEALQRLAAELERTPGKRVFERETGIRESDWIGKHWLKWSDMVADAGLTANAWNKRLSDEELALTLATETRRLGRLGLPRVWLTPDL